MTYPSNGGPSLDDTYRVTAKELAQFVQRRENLEAEKKEIAEQIKELNAEFKGRGYDTKILNLVIQRRRKDRSEIEEQEAVLTMYEDALAAVSHEILEDL